MAAHDLNHLEQIERLLEEQRWQDVRQTDENHKSLSLARTTSAYGEPLDLRELASAGANASCIRPTHLGIARPGRWISSGFGKWCIKQVVGHLTEEDKRDFVGRIERMLREPGQRLEVNDQNRVARERHDCDKSVRELLDEFASVRENSLEFLKQLGAADLECQGIHPKIGSSFRSRATARVGLPRPESYETGRSKRSTLLVGLLGQHARLLLLVIRLRDGEIQY